VSGAAAPVADRAPAAARVMLCDDSLVIRAALARMLEADKGIQVVARASNGKLAVEEIKRQVAAGTPIDVVVLDIEMPVMDGMAALPEILKADPGIRVLMASTLTTRCGRCAWGPRTTWPSPARRRLPMTVSVPTCWPRSAAFRARACSAGPGRRRRARR